MRIALLSLAGALALAGCGRSEPEPDEGNFDNAAIEAPAPDIEMPAENLATPPENVTNAVPPAAPPPEFTEDEQMLDDADATGLTARLPQNETESPSPTENEARPAE
ncbi:hypothetical protein [Sphingomonas sp. LaA6.9]|uniref:hypothetical protein n=1 Tax=Sphingomonas sp. LaA6.9 TaxID=2919914 RepID=UPI001F4F84A3|nr:hypothetical protein [Sphingomonas sp. LaA6.9]MCJ8158920.1 hypothetical protein [Sphingomonas sp. LaA6.9]